MKSFQIHHRILELVQGDITEQDVDAIVNAANSGLAGGSGVDGAIHKAGGPSIMEETHKKFPQGCPTGSAVLTAGGKLKARHVIHAVGPKWNGGGHGEDMQLADAYKDSLRLAREQGLKTIAFPSISTGAYNFPLDRAAGIALQAVIDHLRAETSLETVRFVLFDEATFKTYERELGLVAGASTQTT